MSEPRLRLRRDPRTTLVLLLGLAAAAVASLRWDLSAVASWSATRHSWQRLVEFLTAFTAPDLSAATLTAVAARCGETVAVALLGMALGTTLALPLAMLASRALDGASPPRRGAVGRRLRRELARILLDVLRGVPDFVFVLVLVGCTGFSAWTGVVGIALSVAGSLGKVGSELWDNVPSHRHAAVTATGAGRLAAFCYGVLPLSARTLASFWLLRFECTLRNASVIGVVGGGGLGASLWESFKDSRYDQVATTLLALLVLTATADLVANALRRQLRQPASPRHHTTGTEPARSRRRRAAVALGAMLAVATSVVALVPEWQRLTAALASMEPSYPLQFATRLFLTPDPTAVPAALREAVVPLAIACLGTLAATAIAVLLVYPASLQFQWQAGGFTGARHSATGRAVALLGVLLTRGAALVWRAVPEVAWVLVLGAFWRQGVLAAVLAVALHSAGVLLRLYVEAIDDLPPRRLEAVGSGCARQVFLYGAVPLCWADWRTHALLQFESNLRLGIVLGMVGAGGLGEAFDGNLRFDRLERAGTFLWAMVLLAAGVDRLSRWLQWRRLRC